jgi:hypothetical protein
LIDARLAGGVIREEDVLKLSLAVLRRDKDDTLEARRWMAFIRFGGSAAADSVEDLVARGRDEEVEEEEEFSLRGSGAAGGHDGAAAAAGSQRSLKEVAVGMLEKEVMEGCLRTGEPRTGMSMILGFPAGLSVTALTVRSLSEFMLEDRDDRDWADSALLSEGGPNSTTESTSSSPEREPSSSLDRYHSWGSGLGLFSSTGVTPSKLCSSTITLSSILETLFWLL